MLKFDLHHRFCTTVDAAEITVCMRVILISLYLFGLCNSSHEFGVLVALDET